MYSYIKGKISEIKPKYITLDCHDIGYMISVSNPYDYQMNSEILVYIYQYVREDKLTLFGFKNNEEKELFIKLLGVKGIGPKSALSILAGDASKSMNAITDGDAKYFKKFPGIGEKSSQQIILDLKGKIIFSDLETNVDNEVYLVLEALGYRAKEINKILPKLDFNQDTSTLVKQALRKLSE